MRSPAWPPDPPFPLPPALTLQIPGRGELFLRDTGGTGPVVMLLHGWMVNADMNWGGAYADLKQAGYRVLAIDSLALSVAPRSSWRLGFSRSGAPRYSGDGLVSVRAATPLGA